MKKGENPYKIVKARKKKARYHLTRFLGERVLVASDKLRISGRNNLSPAESLGLRLLDLVAFF